MRILNKVTKHVLTLTLTLMASIHAAASSITEVEQAQEELKATFSNLEIVNLGESPIEGLFEVNLGSQIIYFHPKSKLLVFGEIFNSEGESLTAKAMQKQAMTTLGGLDMSKTLVIGPKDGKEIIEITDPDCPYCRRMAQFIDGLPADTKVRRRIIFDTRAHPSAKKKAAHILCSENPEEEFARVYQNKVSEFKSCPGVFERLQDHQDMALALGVSATPTVILDGSMEVGFRPGAILDYLNSSDKSEE